MFLNPNSQICFCVRLFFTADALTTVHPIKQDGLIRAVVFMYAKQNDVSSKDFTTQC